LAATVTIIIPARGTLDVSDLPEFRQAIDTFSALLSAVETAFPGRVPRRLVRALDHLREDLVALGGTMVVTAAVHIDP
jgi:hypothetical protein